jgi:hypothetical protein
MDKQTADDALRKQEKEAQDRQQHQQLQQGLERQKQQDEIITKRSKIFVEIISNDPKNDVSFRT